MRGDRKRHAGIGAIRQNHLSNSVRFVATALPGVILIEPQVFQDARGFFLESYNRELFKKNGIRAIFVQDNHSRSAKGTLRGLHYQVAPYEQAKLVRVVQGEIFDVVVDIRPSSKTFGHCQTQVLSAENKKMLYIPAGFAHGFLALKEGTEIIYKVSSVYSPKHERGILWNDPALGIAWPKMDAPYLLSDKDKRFSSLKQKTKA